MDRLPTASASPRPAPTLSPPKPAPIFPPTARTTSSMARRCGSPTAARPTSSPSSPKSAANNFPPFSSSALPRRLERRRRKEDGHQGQLHHPRLFRQRSRTCREPAWRSRPRTHHRFERPQRRTPRASAASPPVHRSTFSRFLLPTPKIARPSAQPSRSSASSSTSWPKWRSASSPSNR